MFGLHFTREGKGVITRVDPLYKFPREVDFPELARMREQVAKSLNALIEFHPEEYVETSDYRAHSNEYGERKRTSKVRGAARISGYDDVTFSVHDTGGEQQVRFFALEFTAYSEAPFTQQQAELITSLTRGMDLYFASHPKYS